jgi:Asp-tRNA(Asn)/Glu-tRNA(Gln) amidotransferase A subunit family amidase
MSSDIYKVQLENIFEGPMDLLVYLIHKNEVNIYDIPISLITDRYLEYIDWMKSCYFITVTGHPAISVPCGFTAEGLPVGVQIVGRHQDDWGVLQLAHAFEQATQLWKRRPAIAE